MHIYSLPEDYRFDYWNTAYEELAKVEKLSQERVKEWSASASMEDRVNWGEVAGVIPAQFTISLSIQISQGLQLLTEHHGVKIDEISGLYFQRFAEIEAHREILFIMGFCFSSQKFIVSPIDISDRINPELKSTHLASYNSRQQTEPVIH